MFWDVTPLSNWIKFENPEQITMSFMASMSEEDYEDMPEGLREFMEKQLAQTKVNLRTPEDITADLINQYQHIDNETTRYYLAIASVMESCLYLDNPSCIESGLHGLGHMAAFNPKIAVPIIDRFLKNAKKLDSQLLNYAKSARTGMIL
ncbi:MAG: hypothetical protein HC892_21175 [Saprospiraceae bacterium]|nr:hypothetical protein [Saprospiraceae bacterium]